MLIKPKGCSVKMIVFKCRDDSALCRAIEFETIYIFKMQIF